MNALAPISSNISSNGLPYNVLSQPVPQKRPDAETFKFIKEWAPTVLSAIAGVAFPVLAPELFAGKMMTELAPLVFNELSSLAFNPETSLLHGLFQLATGKISEKESTQLLITGGLLLLTPLLMSVVPEILSIGTVAAVEDDLLTTGLKTLVPELTSAEPEGVKALKKGIRILHVDDGHDERRIFVANIKKLFKEEPHKKEMKLFTDFTNLNEQVPETEIWVYQLTSIAGSSNGPHISADDDELLKICEKMDIIFSDNDFSDTKNWSGAKLMAFLKEKLPHKPRMLLTAKSLEELERETKGLFTARHVTGNQFYVEKPWQHPALIPVFQRIGLLLPSS